MQTKKNELKRQQDVLKTLGFYRGQPDGIWGPRCIEAKREFEAKPEFSPALQNNGLPFAIGAPLPEGIKLDPADRNLITCEGLEVAEPVKAKDTTQEEPALKLDRVEEKPALKLDRVEEKQKEPEVEEPIVDTTHVRTGNKHDRHQQKHKQGKQKR